MVEYRLYQLDKAGQIIGAAEVVQAASDDEALAVVRAQQRTRACELWHGGRLVGRVAPAAGGEGDRD